MAKMEEKAANTIKNADKIKNKLGGLRTSKSDNIADYELKLTLSKKAPQEMPKISPEEFAAILEKHSKVAEYDVVTTLLQMIPEDCDPSLVDQMVAENQGVLDVVNYRLFELISTESFMQGVVQIGDIGSNLESSMILAKNGRRVVQHAMEDFKGVFAVLQKLQRRHNLVKIAEDLERVQRVLSAHEQLQLAHSRGDYPEAVRLFLVCLENMKLCSPLAIVNELASILQETYTQIQARLDKALVDCCHSFNPQTYEKVFNAYKILGKSSRIVEKMQSSFVDPIETETRSILLAHVLLAPQNMARAEQCKNQMKFKELCEALTVDHYVNCLLTILEYLFEVMSSHYTMKKWHQDKQKDCDDKKYFSDVSNEMDTFKKTMWDSMQRRVAAIFASPNLSSYKIDDFLKVLDGVFQFVDIGEGFGNSMAANLRNAILQQSKSYFETFHKNRADELRAMLSNESWVRCPVSPKFTLGDIKEFSSVISGQLNKRKSSMVATTAPEVKFLAVLTTGNPFSKMIQYQKKNAITQAAPDVDSDDEPEELKADQVDEGDSTPPTTNKRKTEVSTEGPILTTTVINVVKILGKYLYMLKVLPPIAFEVFVGITQVFQYYMYTTYVFFGAPPPIEKASTNVIQQQLIGGFNEAQKFIGLADDTTIPPKLKLTVQRLKDRFGNFSDKFNPITLTASSLSSALQSMENRNLPMTDEVLKVKWNPPKLPNLELNNPKTNYGLIYKIMGIESLAFLASAVQEAKLYVQTCLPTTATEYFNSFYNDDVIAAEQFRPFAYKTNVGALLNTRQFTEAVLAVNWDSTVVPTKASPYVDLMLKEYQQFAKKLEEAIKIPYFPTKAKLSLWEGALVRGCEQLVDAYSRIKKCSNEGRVVMMQDVDTLREKLEKLSGLRPIPNISYVETYVRAFYQLLLDPNADVIAWYKQHPEYTANQIISLLNLGGTQNVFQNARRQTIINNLKELGK
eukprot:Phypoly_transcript_01172.p1 GENE.Phypoly_transcript_01172~~Phypoly_transcript_01172.p1  ORF type:complete len:1005 (+),score=148.92 Phypoly_transcript_01172:117-3017(+)